MDKTTTQELLAQAEKLCAQRNVRFTPQRLEVLRLMSLQEGLSAPMICSTCCGKRAAGQAANRVSCARFSAGTRVCA
jgi:Fe2+ or Zn2+ uptake regulation protein